MNIELKFLDAHQYWVARRKDLRWIGDPDVQEKRQRHSDRQSIDWYAIARCIDQASSLLVAKVDAGEEWSRVVVDSGSELGRAEHRILESWGRSGGVCPRMDPDQSLLGDGRHRLWSCWVAVRSRFS